MQNKKPAVSSSLKQRDQDGMLKRGDIKSISVPQGLQKVRTILSMLAKK
jgi:hypothetical protein